MGPTSKPCCALATCDQTTILCFLVKIEGVSPFSIVLAPSTPLQRLFVFLQILLKHIKKCTFTEILTAYSPPSYRVNDLVVACGLLSISAVFRSRNG